MIRDIADALIDEVVEQGEMDVLQDFAHHLPVRVIGTMLGVPEGDYPTFASWTTTLGHAFSPVIDDALRLQLEQAICGLDDYVRHLIDKRRPEPGDDLLTQLIAAEENGDRLSVDELIAMVENLLFAGHDTTRGLLSIAVPLLCDHPDQLDRCADRLRDDGPRGRRDIALRTSRDGWSARGCRPVWITPGVTIDEGERVLISVAAASRQPARHSTIPTGSTSPAPTRPSSRASVKASTTASVPRSHTPEPRSRWANCSNAAAQSN